MSCSGIPQAAANKSVWYKFVTPPGGGTITADTNGSPLNSILSTWTGVAGNLLAVPGACRLNGGGASVSFIATAGTTYYFMSTDLEGLGGTTYFHLSFTGPNPTPSAGSLSPNTAVVGGPSCILTVTGSTFVSGAMVRWNGTGRPTTFVNGTTVTATISAADIASAGSAGVTVFNPAPGGGASNVLTFTITR